MSAPLDTLSLIAAPDAPPIGPEVLAIIAKFGCDRQPIWLSHGYACDLPADKNCLANLPVMRNELWDSRVDVNLVSSVGRRKRLLLADMDSTMVEQETLDELAAAHGVKDQVAAITRRAMAGELDFADALAARVAMIVGMPRATLVKTARHLQFRPGGAELVATMQKYGAYTALVSGGFVEFVATAAKRLNFDTYRCNRFVFVDNKVAGIASPLFDQGSKLAELETMAHDLQLRPCDAIAVGDGANDIPMLQTAGLGVAYRGKRRVRSEVSTQINHADLRALLYLQGFSDEQITHGD